MGQGQDHKNKKEEMFLPQFVFFVTLVGVARSRGHGSSDFPLVFGTTFQDITIQSEASLLDIDGNRITLPKSEFVLEGPNCEAMMQPYGLEISNHESMCVLWYTTEVQNDVVIDFTMTPLDTSDGLGIVFWNARGLDNSSIFALDQPPRYGDFLTYNNDQITNSRHRSRILNNQAWSGKCARCTRA